MSDLELYINGIDGITGEYLVEPLDFEAAHSLITGNPMDPELARLLARLWRVMSQPSLSLPMEIDPKDVSRAGWGIVFHRDEDQAVKDALAPLIEHRRSTVGADRIKVLEYQSNESWLRWISRYGVSAGTVEPRRVPFYLLLVGSPRHIPFDFGHLLNVEYAVGRLDFDTPADYARYARDLIAYENREVPLNRREVVFFAPRHDFERSTKLSADFLVDPLADGEREQDDQPMEPGIAARWGYCSRKLSGPEATKQALTALLAPTTPAGTPAFLFTASHGIGFPRGHPDQLPKQGALVCQDWPALGTISPAHYFSASDLPGDAQVRGMIAFHVACFSLGTPTHDRFLFVRDNPQPRIADEPFFAALPRALLTHRNGGALACIGHIERAWNCAYRSARGITQLQPFRNAIGRILNGQPVGFALKDFPERYAALSTGLNNSLQEIGLGGSVSLEEMRFAWAERNDAGGYGLLGDPAVRLRVDELV
jgi:hypothetical protein